MLFSLGVVRYDFSILSYVAPSQKTSRYDILSRYSTNLTFCVFCRLLLLLQEISTIFLVLCNFDVYFPAERGSTWGAIITVCQASFTVLFLYYRVIGWIMVSWQLWTDVFYVAKKGRIEEYRPGKAWFLYGFLIMDTVLGALQIYWFAFGIVPKILEILQ